MASEPRKTTYVHNERPFYALRFTCNFDEIEAFVGGDAEFRGGKLCVATRQGPLTASDGDWIVESMSGEFSAVPDATFRLEYSLHRLRPSRQHDRFA